MIIYKATNKINNKIYIGQSVNSLEHRKNQHFRETRSEKKKNSYFHNAIAKYGEDAFIFEVIDTTESLEELNNKEQYYISFYNSTDNSIGYNLDSGGNNNKKSESTKRKIGDASLERWKNPEMAEKMLKGLNKATLAWQEKCENERVEFICPVCKKSFRLPKWEANKKIYCSNECRKISGDYAANAKKASECAAIANKKRNQLRKEIMAQDILNWSQ